MQRYGRRNWADRKEKSWSLVPRLDDKNTHSNSKINTHERDVELPERDVHSDSEAKRSNMETRT